VVPDSMATAWRDPSGTVAILQLPLHEDWVGRRIAEVEQAAGVRIAFIVRFGVGVLPKADTVVQAGDLVYAAALSGTISAVSAAATAPPEGT
jgi:trk system potassium uptake protein